MMFFSSLPHLEGSRNIFWICRRSFGVCKGLFWEFTSSWPGILATPSQQSITWKLVPSNNLSPGNCWWMVASGTYWHWFSHVYPLGFEISISLACPPGPPAVSSDITDIISPSAIGAILFQRRQSSNQHSSLLARSYWHTPLQHNEPSTDWTSILVSEFLSFLNFHGTFSLTEEHRLLLGPASSAKNPDFIHAGPNQPRTT